jgi:pimeloyl-ACP methyl ester carboxylesterase
LGENQQESPPFSSAVDIGGGVSIHYASSGQGDTPLVFVPGWTMTTEVFERQFSHFASSKRFRFISYDPRSQGKSTQTTWGSHYEQRGRDLHAFLKAMRLERAVLVGWSNGLYDVLFYIN